MKILFILTLLLSLSQPLIAAEISDAKKLVIDEMLELTGAMKVGELMANSVSDQMIEALSQQQQAEVPPSIVAIVKDETRKIMHAEFIENGFIQNISYEIYDKYFSLGELQEMVNFYKTPTGKKLSQLLPAITQESMAAGQAHGNSLGPIIQRRMAARFEREGLLD